MKKMNSTGLRLLMKGEVESMQYVINIKTTCTESKNHVFTVVTKHNSSLDEFVDSLERFDEIFNLKFINNELEVRLENGKYVGIVTNNYYVAELEEECEFCHREKMRKRYENSEFADWEFFEFCC